MIGIDFVSPLTPKAEDGSNYILAISDYFTKLAEALQMCLNCCCCTLQGITAHNVNYLQKWILCWYITYVYQVFMRMGIPQVVVSDQKGEFNNTLDDELATLLGISRRLTTPYHPQENVLNTTVIHLMAKCAMILYMYLQHYVHVHVLHECPVP